MKRYDLRFFDVEYYIFGLLLFVELTSKRFNILEFNMFNICLRKYHDMLTYLTFIILQNRVIYEMLFSGIQISIVVSITR